MAISPGPLEPPEAGRGRAHPPLEPPEGAQPWDTLILDSGPGSVSASPGVVCPYSSTRLPLRPWSKKPAAGMEFKVESEPDLGARVGG